ncbi:MBL fold metallo-hydrolase [Microtetraspora sp. NBRC 13810]|uniref:MBL fold metallo-hydrolase n=1 Tax=Microtetraspora sp. NBRC 13810 TaxID=3030990 RepID=UPI0024A432F0|nr:MBL fold metallo-hydrolase [Microtetraspora sp. NBRC 13810]GLW11653.1 MBL fold metallo-hydrolase [Microtetraspora sp. NBRC 13810]
MSRAQSGVSRRALLAGAALLPLAGRGAEASAATAPKGPQDYYDRAAKLAGDDPVLRDLVKALTPGSPMPTVQRVKPLRIFDNVAVVSTAFVSVTAILTSQGVILIDALGSPDEVEKILLPDLRSVGVDPAKIKYVVAAHGHSDHFGGAQHLADRYGARVMMSPADWDLVAADSPPDAPTRDLEIADGRRLTLGDTTVTFHHTPGHTRGTVSAIFPVRWKGRRHTAMLWGGTNPPAATAEKRTLVSSVLDFSAQMKRAGVDVELNNHGTCDHGLARMEQLRGSTGAGNPFVIGRSRAQGFMKVMETMLRGRIATDLAAKPTATPATAAARACC